MPRENELHLLSHYQWPGNIRELQNAVERAVVLGTGDHLSIDLMLPQSPNIMLSDKTVKSHPKTYNYKTTMDELERSFLSDLLHAAHGNLSEAARMSGIYRANIYRMAKRLDIDLGREAEHAKH
jgi:DNA-binding NtrC family response regulator